MNEFGRKRFNSERITVEYHSCSRKSKQILHERVNKFRQKAKIYTIILEISIINLADNYNLILT